VFRYRLYWPTGDDAGEIELAIPTVGPGETIFAGDGRKLLVLDSAYDLPEDSLYRGLLTVEEVATPPATRERVTIDSTVVFDYLWPHRQRHAQAVALFQLARRGGIDLISAPQGRRLDVSHGDMSERLTDILRREGVDSALQLGYVSEVTFPSNDPMVVVAGFRQAWADAIETWRTHEGAPPSLADSFHVETHIAQGGDVFITDDGPLLAMCRRLRAEYGFSTLAMRLVEYLDSR
jgi:hypothetical protein